MNTSRPASLAATLSGQGLRFARLCLTALGVSSLLLGCGGGDGEITDAGVDVVLAPDAISSDVHALDAGGAACSLAVPDGRCPGDRVCREGACIVDLDPGAPVSSADATQLFEQLWRFYDEGYGAFSAKPALDWATIKATYAPRVARAKTTFALNWTLQQMVDEIGDGHTYALDKGQCALTGLWGQSYSNVGACVTEADDGALYVYRLGGQNPAGFALGDRLVSIDGRGVEALLQDAAAQPRCILGASTEAMRRAKLIDSLLFRGAQDRQVVVERAGQQVTLSLAPTGNQSPLRCDSLVGVKGTTELAYGILHRTLGKVLYIRLPMFGGYDAQGNFISQPVVDELRKAFALAANHEGLLLDLRANPGGSPAVYVAIASWLFAQTTTLFRCSDKTGPGHADLGAPWAMTASPDATLNYSGPMALLVSPTTFSAGDFASYFLQATGRARTFGAPSGGGFGNGNSKALGQSWTLGFNNIFCVDLEGKALEGQPKPVDEPLRYSVADLKVGKDTLIEAASSWLAKQGTTP
jgi:C-terminal processing protease CtpA/Prc